MSATAEKHMEAAGEICSRITEFGEPAQEVIAAALASAEREGMKRAAEMAKPTGDRPCDCDRCYCCNAGDLELVAAWDQQDALYRAILSECGEG